MLPDEAVPHRGYRVHPVMLEAALQGLAAAMPVESLADSAEFTYLPCHWDDPGVRRCRRRARCRAELVSVDDDGAGMRGRVTLMDAGTATAEVTGVYLRRVQRPMVPLPLARKVFDTVWVPASSSGDETGDIGCG